MGRTCSLCGGKVDRDHICRECGLDNSKCDANYVVNRSACDHRPLTHVHEEKEESKWESSIGENTEKNIAYSGKTMQKPKKKRRATKAATIAVLCAIGAQLISIVPGVVQEIAGDKIERIFDGMDDWEEEDDYDNYQYVTRQIPAEGEEYTVFLGRGEYIVGVHIPEGIYSCNAGGEYAAIGVEDIENNIWLYEWVDEDQPEVTDIRLYSGAVVEISGEAMLELTTVNAQTEGMASEVKPLDTAAVSIQKGAVAGRDFPAGVYDMKLEAGYGSFDVEIYDEEEVIEEKYLWLDADDEVENSYKNLVLPENAKITWENEEELSLILTPSQQIKDTDYMGYYKR